jgi:NAD+ diphosphatase
MDFTYCPRCAKPLEPKVVEEGRTRMACPDPACGFVHYDNPVPVVAGIVQRGESVILIQNKGWPGSWYGLVTGFLEREESPEEGLLREIQEELGLEGTIESFVGNYGFARMNQVILAYHVTVEGEPVLGVELADLKIVPVEKLKPWPFGTGDAVRDWLARRG